MLKLSTVVTSCKKLLDCVVVKRCRLVFQKASFYTITSAVSRVQSQLNLEAMGSKGALHSYVQ